MNCNETSIYNLYGALFESTQEGFPLRSLYAMLGTLGMSEDAVRLALSRMARKGLLYTKRKGRSSYYFLSEAGASIMRRGADRSVFRGAPAKWDGKLRLLSYEFPESLRDQRNGLAAALRSAGFGRAASGLWVHAYGYPDAVMDLVRNADVSAAIDTYEATLTGDGPAFARRVWRLDECRKALDAYIARYSRELDELNGRTGAGGALEPADCFGRYFRSLGDFVPAMASAPPVPDELLPADWPARAAAGLFTAYRAMVRDGGQLFFDSIYEPFGD